MRGKLFTEDFLLEGITETRAWRDLKADEVDRFEDTIRRVLEAFPVSGTPNEATTENDLIYPVLDALGWEHYLAQQTTSGRGRRDVPDLLLFPDGSAKRDAQAEKQEARRYRYGSAVLEAKRWERTLDRGERRGGAAPVLAEGAPSTQMLRYLSRAETVSEGAVRWGILTNGRLWRLYWQGARSRSEEFQELDLAVLAGVAGVQASLVSAEADRRTHFLRAFYLLFHRPSFLPQAEDPEGRTFHELAQAESRRWEEKVSSELGKVVFEDVFPRLLQSLLRHDPLARQDAGVNDPLSAEYREELRRAALAFLYRLLFVLYAEDRNLLPVHDSRYDDYSLRFVREDLRRRVDGGDAFSERAANYYNRLKGLFGAVAEGDPGIGLPPYDGGLFAPKAHPLLDRVQVPDAELAPLLDALSRRAEGDERHWINYRDLSVQQLGSIYERLLEFEPSIEEVEGELRLSLRPNVFARKTSGSYYTHDDLVRLILEQAVGPLLEEISGGFHQANERLASHTAAKDARLDELLRSDPASRILDLKICDPAMGSGHFLVSLVDYLADEVLEAMAEAEAEVDWAPEDVPYRSPLAQRIEGIRSKIQDKALAEDWLIQEEELDDRHIVRRIILKRMVYGVDKNPMAVELAKVALWLHTFTTGAPLSFLDHHLRSGDSLYGEWLDDVRDELESISPLYMANVRASIAAAAATMNQIARISDDDISKVEESREYFEQAEEVLEPLRRLLDLWHGRRWLQAAGGKKGAGEHPGFAPLLRGSMGDLMDVLEAGEVDPASYSQPEEAEAVNDLLLKIRALAERERFLHWELAFPTVWEKIGTGGRQGGFDAVIGNPPWDRLKLQQVEWFSAREPDIARSSRASDRKKKIRRLEKEGDTLWDLFQGAKDAAETAARVARQSGHFPLLARGDINIYSLFVERAQDLIQPEGLVGLLVPSGIASDKTSSEFFSGIATGGRLRTLYDFENKKVFFPDIHASFKFSVFVFGGSERCFEEADCAFFLHAVEELEEPERSFPLGPEDFAAVNPNTGTVPIFRSRRDAELTTAIYERVPVLVDRSREETVKAWPVHYGTVFHMTNDSGYFKTGEELDEEGFYRVEGNRWKKGERVAVPLYVGKLIYQFDHRAASVVVNPDNVHNVAYSRPTTEEEHQDPQFTPAPQYWVEKSAVEEKGRAGDWGLAFRDIARATDARTMIATVIPSLAAGNKLPFLLPDEGSLESFAEKASLLVAQLNAFVFDFVARQKIHSTNANWYIVEQLPFLPPERFEEKLGGEVLGRFTRQEVLRLTYTASDLEPFARALGYEGDPFLWDEEDRRHCRARLDALFFHLYGIDRTDADLHPQPVPHRAGGRREGLRTLPDSGSGAGIHERSGSRGFGGAGWDVRGEPRAAGSLIPKAGRD